jgi:hypothetical protein
MNIYDRHESQVIEDLKSAKSIIIEFDIDCEIAEVAKLIAKQREWDQKERFIQAFRSAFVCFEGAPSALELIAMNFDK